MSLTLLVHPCTSALHQYGRGHRMQLPNVMAIHQMGLDRHPLLCGSVLSIHTQLKTLVWLTRTGAAGAKGTCREPKTKARRAPCPVGTFILFFNAPQALHGPKGLAGSPKPWPEGPCWGAQANRKQSISQIYFFLNALRKNRALRKKSTVRTSLEWLTQYKITSSSSSYTLGA